EPATLLHVCFKVGELLVGQLTNVEQEDARKLPDVGPLQRFGGDAAAKLVAVDYLVTGAWNRNDRGVDEEAVLVFLPTARAVAVDDQHWNLVADLDGGVADVVGSDGIRIHLAALPALQARRNLREVRLSWFALRRKAQLESCREVALVRRNFDRQRRI